MIRAQKCPHCSRPVSLLKETPYPDLKIIIYNLKCGHVVTEKIEKLDLEPWDACVCKHLFQDHTSDGRSCHRCVECRHFSKEEPRDAIWALNYPYGPMPFQKEGVEFFERSNFNVLCADEMGLGKTIQALLTLRYNFDTLAPTIITCKASLTYNWLREYLKWVCNVFPVGHPLYLEGAESKIPADRMPYLYTDGTLPLFPGFKVYIIPMSLLGREEVQKTLREVIKPKLIIGDEVHNFKSTRSQRTQALYDILDGIERKDGKIVKQHHKVPHRIMLSGTPVINRLFEYFPILHIIKPIHFSDIKSFAARWVDYDPATKKWLGLKSVAKNAFFDLTSTYVIRRDRSTLQKMGLLPTRLADATLYTDDFQSDYARQYNKGLDELEDIIMDKSFNAHKDGEILGIMSRLRHLAGLLKIKAAVQWSLELLENTNEKLLIGIHHKDVALLLQAGLAQYDPIMISGDDNALAKDQKVTLSKSPNHRVVIGNIEACGEGINGLQESFNNVLILERGWSPSRENQFIGRLDRPGQKLSVFATFLIAARTLDEFFVDLLAFKDNITKDASKQDFALDREMMKQLAMKVISSRLKVVGV